MLVHEDFYFSDYLGKMSKNVSACVLPSLCTRSIHSGTEAKEAQDGLPRTPPIPFEGTVNHKGLADVADRPELLLRTY